MRKFRNICIEWIGTCILVQIALTFGVIWFFNNMVTITTHSTRNANKCITHINKSDNEDYHNSPYFALSRLRDCSEIIQLLSKAIISFN